MHMHVPNIWICQNLSFEISLIDLASRQSQAFFSDSQYLLPTSLVASNCCSHGIFFFYQDRMVIFTLRDEQSTAPEAFLCGKDVFCFILDWL